MDPVSALMNIAAPILTHHWAATIFVGNIFAVLFFLWNKFETPLTQLSKSLSEICADIEKFFPEDRSEWTHASCRYRFFKNFEEISDRFSKCKYTRRQWEEFSETLLFSTKEDGPKVIHLSQRPSHYFNRDTIVATQINLLQFGAAPNYLVGIGLLFTFLGIAAALHVAQAGLAAPDNGQKAMHDLLAVAATKFLSSLAGITCSIILGVKLKTHLVNTEKKIEKLCDLIELGTQFKSVASLISEGNQELVKHTAALNDLAENIGTRLEESLSNKLPNSVAQALAPLATEIKELAKKFSGSNEDALQQVLQEFLTQMRQSTGDDMTNLMSSVGQLKGSLDDLFEKMKITGETFGSGAEQSTAKLSQALENFSNSFLPVQQGLHQFGTTLNTLDSISEKIEQAGGNMSGAADASHQSMSKLANSVTDLSNQIAPLQDLVNRLSDALGVISSSASNLQSAGNAISSAANGFQSSADVFGQAGGKLEENINRFGLVTTQLTGSVSTLESTSEKMGSLSSPLTDASKAMSQVLLEMQQTERRVQETQRELNGLISNLEKYSSTIPQLWEQYQGRFSDVDVALSKSFEEITKGSSEFQSSVKDFVNNLDASFTKSVGQLSAVIDELAAEREQETPYSAPQAVNAG